jgi:3-hydroxyisobutyrate dehydrogenase-like beta-hydroxyacid dehydrogenase
MMNDVVPPPASQIGASPPELVVGFAGLGRMGLPMAERLIQSGVPVVAYDRTQSKAEALAARGARWNASPRDLAKSIGKGVTFLMLTDGKAVRTVLFGRGGYARGAPAGALVVNMSTIDPDESRALAARLLERGIHYVDAPVAGSIDFAAKGEVTFFAGGELPDIARARPLLERMGRTVEYMGPVGTGNATKLVNNLLTIGITALSAEALALAEGFQLERERIIKVLLDGGGRSAMLERKTPAFLSRQYPAQFTTELARKDLKLVEKAAAREGRALRMTREARKLLEAAMAQGHAVDDFSSVFEVIMASKPTATAGPSPAEVSPPKEEPPPSGSPPN